MSDLPTVLMADDEWEIAGWDRIFKRKLPQISFLFESQSNNVLPYIHSHPEIDCLLLDITFSGQKMQGLDVLGLVRSEFPDLPVIMFSVDTSPATAAKFGKAGVFDYFSKEYLDLERLNIAIQNATRQYRLTLRLQDTVDDTILGISASINNLKRMIKAVARLNDPVLVLGESGVGKTLVARAIHRASLRSDRNFVQISPADYPDNFFESALFGHRRGAFTDARFDRKGLLEEADGGTLFLDEIGELSLESQTKMLHFLQEQSFRPLGDNQEKKVDVRIIMATNQNLERLVKENKIRQDFFFRVNRLVIEVPPLRERVEDIELLASFFLLQRRKTNETSVTGLAPETIQMLNSYSWPGNVRQLQNAIAQACIQADLQNSLELLPTHFRLQDAPLDNNAQKIQETESIISEEIISEQRAPLELPDFSPSGINLPLVLADVELYYLEQALQFVRGKKTKAHVFLNFKDRLLFMKRVLYNLNKFPELRKKYPYLSALYADKLRDEKDD